MTVAKMTQAQAEGWIVTSLAVTGTLAVIRMGKEGERAGVRLAVGLTVTGVMLATVAQSSPTMAGGMAVLIMTSAAFAYGDTVWKSIGGILPAKKSGGTRRLPDGTEIPYVPGEAGAPGRGGIIF